MTILFLKPSPKIHKSGIFCFFRELLQIDNFEGAGFKSDNAFLKFLPKNTPIRHFWSQIYTFLFFREILQIDKFEGNDFKSDNSFLKILPQKYPNKAIFVKNTQKWHFGSKSRHYCLFIKFCN